MIEAMVWLAIFIVTIIIELATMGLVTIWFSGGALIALLVSVMGAPLWLQVTLFFVVSIILICFTRPLALKYFNKGRIKTNADSLLGEIAVVTETIDNIQGKGEVRINGLEWSARAAKDDMIISKDSKVVVQKIEGVKLIVIPNTEN